MTEWQKLATKMIGDDVKGNFASNIGKATLSEDFLGFVDQPQLDANWQPIGTPLPQIITANFATKVIDWDFVRTGDPIGNRSVSYDLFEQGRFDALGSLASDGNWAFRWKMTFGSGLTAPTVNTNAGYVGLFASSTLASDAIQSFIALRFLMNSGGTREIAIVTGNAATPDVPTTVNAFSTPSFNSDDVIYCELKRTADGNIEATLYSDADYSVILEKIKVTGIATAIIDLEFLKVMNTDNLVGDGVFSGTIAELEFFNKSEGLQDFFTVKGNDKVFTYDAIQDLITGQNPSDFLADLSSATGWVDPGTSEIFIQPLNRWIKCLVDADAGNDSIANDILGTTVSDTAWVLRGSFNIADFNGANATPKRLFIGMFSDNQVFAATFAQDGIFFVINSDNTFSTTKTGTVALYHSDGITPQSASVDANFTNDPFQPMLEGRYFYELKRLSATEIECTIFDERGFAFPLQTVRATIPATVTNLRYIKLMSSIAIAGGRTTATADSFEFWDGVTNACTFNTTPVLEQDVTKARVDYCTNSIFWSGVEENANESVSIDLGQTLSDSKFVFRCKIDVTDFFIQPINVPRNWIGLFDLDSASAGQTVQSGIALRADPENNAYNPSSNADTILANWGAGTTYTDLPIQKGVFYLEIARLSTTLARISLYRDELFCDLIQTRTFTILATVNDLRYFAIKNRIDLLNTAKWEVIVSNIQIWDNVSNVDGFEVFNNLDIQTKANSINGIIRAGYLFNAHDESGDYHKITSINNGADSLVITNRFLDVQQTPSASDVYSFLVLFNRIGQAFNGNVFAKETHGYDAVQANTLGPANIPDRIESVGMIRNFAPTEQVNKIQLRNDQAGDYDTDSEIAVYGTN